MPANRWRRLPVRPAKPASNRHNLIKTLLQTAIFWTLFLFVFPALIVWAETSLGVGRFSFSHQVPFAFVLFLLASMLGLWSGVTMAISGKGTPLPTDTARELVIAGPYRFVRNPMAIAGLTQAACVGMWAGSWSILIYVATGFVIWNVFVRPLEEAELRERFGQPFEKYRDAVRCWIPRLTSFRG